MSDHLPECPAAAGFLHHGCICDRLRACEARCDAKRHAEVKAWADLSRDNFDAGYAAGVQAARDAVAALMGAPSDQDPTPLDFLIYEEVLPAIDALRGES